MHAVHINYIIIRQAMYVQHRTEAHLCNHCFRAQAINITYSEDVFLALRIQHAMRMRRTYCVLRSVRLHHHENAKAIELLDNTCIVRRLQRKKPFELV
jgi:hypothetical protein